MKNFGDFEKTIRLNENKIVFIKESLEKEYVIYPEDDEQDGKIETKDKDLTILSDSSFDFNGDIVILDPCYFKGGILEDKWHIFCEMCFDENSGRKINKKDISKSGTLICNNAIILYTGTAFGDGVYKPNVKGFKKEGTECGVDAGMLSITHLHDIKKFSKITEEEILELGVIIRKFKGKITADGKGNFLSTVGFSLHTD